MQQALAALLVLAQAATKGSPFRAGHNPPDDRWASCVPCGAIGTMRGENGQAMVEAAIVLPLCVVLILCAVQIAQVQQARVLLEYAAFNAARAGVVHDAENGASGTS